MAQVAVEGMCGAVAGQGFGHLQHLGDLRAHVAVVHEAHGLVVQVFVGVALAGQHALQPGLAPDRPVVLGDQDLCLAAIGVQGVVQVA
ncbi:hypothetical protein GY14_21765 [Delftia tsuruhatensis]|nr:hypothetical protein GY14_21765 [Delftia tsuruhatensis]